MCGIVGYVGSEPAIGFLLDGLAKLEYRGYDSAGISIIESSQFSVHRATGKLSNLRAKLHSEQSPVIGKTGIGHTRWATHGRPSENNAHPHTYNRVSLIHNGIIENYVSLRDELIEKGHEFLSETDTEIVAHLLSDFLISELTLQDALAKLCESIHGSYSLVAIDRENPDKLLVAKSASPLVIGIGENEGMVASDIPALLEKTRRVVILEDGDYGLIGRDSFELFQKRKEVQREVQIVSWDPVTAQKGGYKHFMLKEIHEQPAVVAETFRSRIDPVDGTVRLSELRLSPEHIQQLTRIRIVGCGTAWHAGLVIRNAIEYFSRIPCEVEYASEFRYRDFLDDPNELLLCVSQSGETADTLGALQRSDSVMATAAICNVIGSSIARTVDSLILTHAGPEISVASTKAFTTQIVAGLLLAVELGRARNTFTEQQSRGFVENLMRLPQLLESALSVEEQVKGIAQQFSNSTDFLYLGRGNCYPIALEGALKLKEISYIHAEGYPAGEMKHGPIALIDENMPVVFIVQRSEILLQKTLSSLREVEARRGRIIVVTDAELDSETRALCEAVIELPFVAEYLSPISLTVPLQLLSYYVAVNRGTDVDLPRNLAKSVTVE